MGKSKKIKSPFDMAEDANLLIVNAYRRIALERGCAPTSATSDEEILKIYTKVATAFRNVAQQRGENLSAPTLNFIVLYFFQNNEMFGTESMNSHLQYELDKYLKQGLRPTYRDELSLF